MTLNTKQVRRAPRSVEALQLCAPTPHARGGARRPRRRAARVSASPTLAACAPLPLAARRRFRAAPARLTVPAAARAPCAAQLLQLVVDFPKKSTCDMRFLSHIWEAFLRWCAMQFEDKVGVRVLSLGEFCYRADSIGGMDFLNPMFIMNEAFAGSFGLHDRRPKNVTTAGVEAVDLDMGAIAALTTDLIGEVVTKEVVDAALQDVVERIGDVCSSPDEHGIVHVDFGFAKLFCENKSIEFSFGTGGGAPATASSAKSAGSAKAGMFPPLGGSRRKADDEMSVGGSSMLGKKPAPLQRPHRPVMRPKHLIAQYKKDEILTSHEGQREHREGLLSMAREEEMGQHIETLQRLRSEMVLDYSQREQRKELSKMLAAHQKVQQEEKRQRDHSTRAVYGAEHWPFRTEEQVQQAVEATNRAQRAFLDQQLAEKAEKVTALRREAEKRQEVEQAQALAELKALSVERKGGRAPPPAGKAAGGTKPPHGVERALEDAFSRYEDYLHARKEGIESSSSFVREQRYLSEQAEVLKGEENRRRMSEMRAYLDRQVKDKEAARQAAKESKALEDPRALNRALPAGAAIDGEEEAYVKMALKHALDGQVERKQLVKEEERATELRAEQQALGHVAAEMQEARYRAYSERREQEAALRATWGKQHALKLMEATLEKAEAA